MTMSFRQEAIDDLTSIWQYSAKTWSENQADLYYEQLKISCQELLRNPWKGRKYSIVESDLMGFKVNKHIVFYIVLESQKEIEIVRILHEKMDLRNHLN